MSTSFPRAEAGDRRKSLTIRTVRTNCVQWTIMPTTASRKSRY
jgi:hypothetical protein